MSPQELADVFSAYRDRLEQFGTGRPLKRRDRGMTQKHLALAVFHHEHRGEKGEDQLVAWNERHPEWRYAPDSIRNFQRDMLVAYRRLTGRGAVPVKGGNEE